jgi:hypothetical protein
MKYYLDSLYYIEVLMSIIYFNLKGEKSNLYDTPIIPAIYWSANVQREW